MSFSHLFYGSVGVSSYQGATPLISLNADSGDITCNNIIGNINANVNVNLDSINNNINTLFNITSNHNGDILTLYTTTNSQGNTLTLHNSTLNNHNDYFNDINAAFLGLEEATENAQNDIINLQLNFTNQQNQINGLILTDSNFSNNFNSINLILPNKVNINDLSNYTLINNTVYIQTNGDIQSALNNVSAGQCIKLGTGSYSGSNLTITDKTNFIIDSPPGGSGPLTVLGQSLTIQGNISTRFRMSNVSLPTLTINGTEGRHQFLNCVFDNVLITGATLNFLIFRDCSISSTLQIDPLFSGVVFFINCDLSGCVLTLNNSVNQQVIFANCLNFSSYPTKCEFLGLAGLSTGESRIFGNDIKISGSQPLINLSDNLGNQILINESLLTLNHSAGLGENSPFISLYSASSGVSSSIFTGANIPNFTATAGSFYLQNTGDFYTYDGINWVSQSIGSQVNIKHLTVRDNPNSNTRIEIDPANNSGMYIQTNGGLETPSITIDKFGGADDSIAVMDYLGYSITHAFTNIDQTQPYLRLTDSTANINANLYFGPNVPNHSAGNGSLFIQGGATPNLYQYNGAGWAGVGGGGGGVVGSYNVPCVSKSTFPSNVNINTSPQTILFDTDTINNPTSWIAAPVSGVWNIPFSGIYNLTALLNINAAGNNSVRGVWYINNVAAGARDIEYTPTGDNTLYISYLAHLNAGDLVDMRASTGSATPLLSVVSAGSYASIQTYRQDPLTLSSVVYIPKLCKYRGSSNYIISGVGVPNQIFFNNPDILIPSNSWITPSSGQMIVLENGIYRVFASLRFTTEAIDRVLNVYVYINGVSVGRDTEFSIASQSNPIITIEAVLSLNANDIITIWADTVRGDSLNSTITGTDESTYYYTEKISV
jgi:hypothetical protein